MEIRRFGPGHRRADGPPGTQGVAGQVIHSDERGLVSELAFGRYAVITPHTNPNLTLFVVISGGGYVQVADERTRVNHGEAIVWPAGVVHGAYTDGSEMRAIVIELPDRDAVGGILEGRAAEVLVAGGSGSDRSDSPRDHTPDIVERAPTERAGGTEPDGRQRPARGEGRLADRHVLRDEYDSSEGEPW